MQDKSSRIQITGPVALWNSRISIYLAGSVNLAGLGDGQDWTPGKNNRALAQKVVLTLQAYYIKRMYPT